MTDEKRTAPAGPCPNLPKSVATGCPVCGSPVVVSPGFRPKTVVQCSNPRCYWSLDITDYHAPVTADR